ncbi:ABC transporter permease [Arcanobacterium haemolyticum]|uniref:ABC transporter permease n=1 Tax=Arcanobacterium haemolyticum TaxID=28264 RepID=UPI000D8DEF08|nr:ABC transporter permease [Arcanobacterium haemolyticum]QCX47202.1 ABC transporter permease [Arcanobacterium haemolyticum]SPT75281.1 Oligopeptide transport system permease protein oppB [Arcanobacterium haemolyticum]
MLKFILRRLLNYLLLLVVAVTLAYFIAGTQLDPRSMLIEAEITSGKNIPYEEVVRTVDQRLTGWNINPTDPILDRFFNWVGMISHWDWGHSPLGNSVNAEIANRVPISLQLVFLGFFIGIIGGVSLGAWAAVHQYSKRDRLITIIAMVIISTPAMVIAVFLQIGATYANNFAGYQLFNFIGPTSAIPPTGFFPALLDRAQHLLLPTISMALASVASYSRIQRNLMLDTLGADYVRTARAKGVRFGTAIRKHALRTALIPIATYFAFGIATLILGAAITEQVYGWNGMGIYSVGTITGSDINGTAAVVAFAGTCTLTGAFLSDVAISLVDPRVRVG